MALQDALSAGGAGLITQIISFLGEKKITGWRWWSQRPTLFCVQMHFAVTVDWKALRDRRHCRARQQLQAGDSFEENIREKKHKIRTQRAGGTSPLGARAAQPTLPPAPHNANHKLYPAPGVTREERSAPIGRRPPRPRAWQRGDGGTQRGAARTAGPPGAGQRGRGWGRGRGRGRLRGGR